MKILKNTIIAASFLASALCADEPLLFQMTEGGTSGQASLDPASLNGMPGFKLSLKRSDKENSYATVHAKYRKMAAAQRKLVFYYKGAKENGLTTLTPVIIVNENGKYKSYNAPSIKINIPDAKKLVLGLDSDFRLGDANWQIEQIKMVINNSPEKAGHLATVEIAGVDIVDADAAGGLSSADLTVYPAKQAEKIQSADAIKIFFDMDNDDSRSDLTSRVTKGAISDKLQYEGYRQMLIDGVPTWATLADSPENADVIVYARVLPGDFAKRIAEAVKKGKGLIAYGQLPDPELKELAGIEASPVDLNALAPRKKLNLKELSHPLFKDASLNTAAFGIYQKTDLKGAKILLSYEDGSPAITENNAGSGKVIYSALGSGADLIKNSSLYDPFMLRGVAYLSGKANASEELKKLDDFNALRKKHTEKRIVASILHGEAKALELDSLLKSVESTKDDSKRRAALEKLNKAYEKATEADGLHYSAGASLENFGRFGWQIGEGLLCDNASRKLNMSNGPHEYGFAFSCSWTMQIPKWDLAPLSGEVLTNGMTKRNDENYNYRWSGLGVVEYTKKVNIPADWKDKKISFCVEGGIDDLDRVFVNGTEIGSTGKDVPGYWAAPRKYQVPNSVLKFGEDNLITMQVENIYLDSSVGSCPRLLAEAAGNKTEKVVFDSVDWTHKSGLITDESGNTRRMTMSLLMPFICYEFPGRQTVMTLENLADRASWLSKGKLVTINLANCNEAFYKQERDGKWDAPYLLLWRAKGGSPLLMIFEHQAEELTVFRSGEIVNGITIASSKPIGNIIAGWPWGLKTVDTKNWDSSIPEDVQSKIKKLSSMLLNFPVGCDEVFAIDEKNAKVKITDKIRYKVIKDDWNSPRTEYAMLPPLAGLALQRKELVESEKVSDWDIPTKFGPLFGKTGSDTVSYSLPLPEPGDFHYVNVPSEEKRKQQINELVAGGLRWSCGGAVRMDYWNPARPAGTKFPDHSIDMFAWCFGLGPGLQGAIFLDDANYTKLLERVRLRYCEPIEVYKYKTGSRYREEPFTGIRYAVYFNSFYPNETPSAPGFSSKVSYGDENEACFVIMNIGQQLADKFGQADLIRSNWNFYRYVMRYLLSQDDWAYNTGSCRESGIGAWIDMLNCEYGAMMKYARLASIAGDQAAYEQGIYRASKRMLPSLMRLYFKDYLKSIGSERGEDADIITGFSEYDGAMPCKGKFADIFESSQGYPEELMLLYGKYAKTAIKDYLMKTSLPYLKDQKGKATLHSLFLPAFAHGGAPADFTAKLADDVFEASAKNLKSDWPGLRTGMDFGSVIYALHPEISIERCHELNLLKADYNPEASTLTLKFQAPDKGGALSISTKREPTSVSVNNKAEDIKELYHNKSLNIPLRPGENNVLIKFK